MNSRIEAELALLRQQYDAVEHLPVDEMDWFRVQFLRTPKDWSPREIPVAFSVTKGYPGAEPYGFFVPEDLNLNGNPPGESSSSHPPPFDGSWRFLSWSPEGWFAAADMHSGPNLWNWVCTFSRRLQEGV